MPAGGGRVPAGGVCVQVVVVVCGGGGGAGRFHGGRGHGGRGGVTLDRVLGGVGVQVVDGVRSGNVQGARGDGVRRLGGDVDHGAEDVHGAGGVAEGLVVDGVHAVHVFRSAGGLLREIGGRLQCGSGVVVEGAHQGVGFVVHVAGARVGAFHVGREVDRGVAGVQGHPVHVH